MGTKVGKSPWKGSRSYSAPILAPIGAPGSAPGSAPARFSVSFSKYHPNNLDSCETPLKAPDTTLYHLTPRVVP